MNEIHVFDPTNRFLGSVEPRLIYDASNEAIIVKHRTSRKAISKYAREMKKKWQRTHSRNSDEQLSSKVFGANFHDSLIEEGGEVDFDFKIDKAEIKPILL